MTKIAWGEAEKPSFEYGVDHGVFYHKDGRGYAWNGLITVEETTADASQSLIYIDGVGHQNRLLIGNFAAAISAMFYPKEFEPYDGYSDTYSGQGRREFNFSYRTMLEGGTYKLHLVYNALATPTDRNDSSINSNTDMVAFTWDLTTRTENIPGARSSSHFTIDSSDTHHSVIDAIEAMLYGSETSPPYMPTVPELLAWFDSHAVLKITDHGDGSWTAEGPDDIVEMLDPTSFQINWKSAIFISSDSYTVRTL